MCGMLTKSASNRFGLDYAAEAHALGKPCVPILDAHTHINGCEAVGVFREAMDLFGIAEVWSMTRLDDLEKIQDALDGRLRPIAIPDFSNEDLLHAMGPGYIERLPKYQALGAHLAKFWAAPRSIDIAEEAGDPGFLKLDHPSRLECMQAAVELGMGIMVHIADPDTWFSTKYSESSRYGTKREQYDHLEVVLDRFPKVPLLAAHMGGWPENLEFLDSLLSQHDNVFLDTSATKWMVRELSVHSREQIIELLQKFGDRILFGSDNVSMDEHLGSSSIAGIRGETALKANTPQSALELYSSRYFALRTLFETNYSGESPIADPDLAMVNPEKYSALDAPQLIGKSLPKEYLPNLYRGAAENLLANIKAMS